MKLLMKYEPKDFMNLVKRDLASKGIQVPDASAITFHMKKGAPFVEVEIEIDDEPSAPLDAPAPRSSPPVLREPTGKEGEEPSMDQIIAESRKLVSGPGNAPRPLMANEFTEFPKD